MRLNAQFPCGPDPPNHEHHLNFVHVWSRAKQEHMIFQAVALKGPVLVVEDDYEVRVTVRSILEVEGYEVCTAINGKDALALLASSSRKPVLALVDLVMPMMDGRQFIEILKRTEALAALPLVVQSAYIDREPPSRIAGFMRTPVDENALLEVVKKHCG
jgi:CheY-like chemotaxis protein